MNEPAAKSSGVSMPVLVLSVLLSVAATAAVMTMLRSRDGATTRIEVPDSSGIAVTAISSESQPHEKAPASKPLRADEPYVQKDVVSPDNHISGQVFYPLPFATPPNLKLTAKERKYDILEQDEFGFTWAARPKLDDFDAKYLDSLKEAQTDPQSLLGTTLRAIAGGVLKPNLTFEDFTWEAKGVRGARLQKPFSQTGEFNSLANSEGQVTYPIPYAAPANVTLNGGNYGYPYTAVVETRADGFKWKNVVQPNDVKWGTGGVTWAAKGLRTVAGE